MIVATQVPARVAALHAMWLKRVQARIRHEAESERINAKRRRRTAKNKRLRPKKPPPTRAEIRARLDRLAAKARGRYAKDPEKFRKRRRDAYRKNHQRERDYDRRYRENKGKR